MISIQEPEKFIERAQVQPEHKAANLPRQKF